MLHEMAEICSLCCVAERSVETCRECEHFIAACKLENKRRASAGGSSPDRHFIIELDPEVEDAVDQALQQAERGDTDRAMEELEELQRRYPRNHMICYGIGTVHALRREHWEAIRWFDEAIALYPFFVEAHFNRAVAFKEELEVASALRAFREVLKIADPSDDVSKQARSIVDGLAEVVRQTECVDLDTYLEVHDEFQRAFALMEEGDWTGALAGFRACAAKSERHAPTHGNMGLCLAQFGRKAEALAALDRALEIDPGYGPALQNRRNVEQMKEGQPLDAGFESIDYARDCHRRQRGEIDE